MLQQIKDNRESQEPIEGTTHTYSHNITLEDGYYYTTWEVPSPLDDVNTHDNYKEENAMFVVCGQQGSLIDVIQTNLEAFIQKDLLWFQLILLAFNILIFVGFLFFFESRL